jgi:hypothetical protein
LGGHGWRGVSLVAEGRLMTGGKLRPWQIGLFVVALIAVGVAAYLSTGSDDVDLAGKVTLVDVTTGELFEKRTGDGKGTAVVPEINPDTNKKSLLPVFLGKDKKYRIEKRYVSMLPADVKPTIIGADGTVTVSDKPAKTLRAKKNS